MIKVVVPVSGGKDSQACLKMATDAYRPDEVIGLFCDTQFEHPITYKHVSYLELLYGVNIVRVCGGSVYDKIRKHRRFPGGGARHCTDELKIRETRLFLDNLVGNNGPFQVWYGMRTDESSARGKRYRDKDPDELYHPHEVLGKYPQYLGEKGIRFRLPVVDWTSDEIFEFLQGEHNPLYDRGFPRVGCFPCLAGGDAWKIKAFEHDETGKRHLINIRILEDEIGKSVFTSGIGDEYNSTEQGCRLCEI